MIEDPTYDKYLKECFASVAIKFNNVEKSLDRIEKHLERQNGSVAKLQEESNKRAIVVEEFRHLEKDFEEFIEKGGQFDSLKQKVDKTDEKLLEIWFFLKHPKVFIGIIVVAIVVALGFVGNRVNNVKETMDILDQKVNLINVPMRTRGGDVVLMPAGVAMDSLNKK